MYIFWEVGDNYREKKLFIKDSATDKEKKAGEILTGVGGDANIKAVIFLHNADAQHEEVWADVEIMPYNSRPGECSITQRLSLFKKNGQIRAQEEWEEFLKMAKAGIIWQALMPIFIKTNSSKLKELSKKFCKTESLSTEEWMICCSVIEESGKKMIANAQKLESLIGINLVME